MNKKILLGSLLVALMLIVPLSAASVLRGPSSISNEISCTTTSNIVELTQEELNQIYDALGFIKEQDPALYITVKQVLNDAVTLTDDGAILDVGVLEAGLKQAYSAGGEPKSGLFLFCKVVNISSNQNIYLRFPKLFTWWISSGKIDIYIESITGIYAATFQHVSGILLHFRGTISSGTLDYIKGKALLCYIREG